MNDTIFHLAFNVTNLFQAKTFYCEVLGAKEGRSSDSWIDLDFFGHQLSLHKGKPVKTELTGKVDGVLVPMPHFGLILSVNNWRIIAERLKNAGVDFILPPTVRFKGEKSEQSTLFFVDPFGNPIELKSFSNMDKVFTA